MFYGFQYASGKSTTTGNPNPKTGELSIAGSLESFRSKKERDEWVARGCITPDMGSNCRIPVESKNIRSFKKGWSKKQWEEWRGFQEQVNYIIS